ncbi:MAG: hypothetical protein V9G04_10055 [Nocardioides sp.]
MKSYEQQLEDEVRTLWNRSPFTAEQMQQLAPFLTVALVGYEDWQLGPERLRRQIEEQSLRDRNFGALAAALAYVERPETTTIDNRLSDFGIQFDRDARSVRRWAERAAAGLAADLARSHWGTTEVEVELLADADHILVRLRRPEVIPRTAHRSFEQEDFAPLARLEYEATGADRVVVESFEAQDDDEFCLEDWVLTPAEAQGFTLRLWWSGTVDLVVTTKLPEHLEAVISVVGDHAYISMKGDDPFWH